MVTVIMTIHMETNTRRAIIENERSARVKRLKTLAEVHINAAEVKSKKEGGEGGGQGERRSEGWSVE